MSIGKEWSDAEFEELRAVFFAQAYEIVDDLQDLLMTLETEPGDADDVRTSSGTSTPSRETPTPWDYRLRAPCATGSRTCSPLALEDESALGRKAWSCCCGR